MPASAPPLARSPESKAPAKPLRSEGAVAFDSSVLLVGGGYSPASSAVALEANVLDYRVLEATLAPPPVRKATLLFGAGDDAAQFDVATRDRAFGPKDALFALYLQGRGVDPALTLRHNGVPGLTGPATVGAFRDALRAQVAAIGSAPAVRPMRGRLFFTGHGVAGGPKEAPHSRNEMLLWDGAIDVPALASDLKGLPADSRYLVVLTQCFSGGFAGVLWDDGREKDAPPRTDRCGFFSQRADRYAAGCSPDLDEREEYSVAFLAALRGRTIEGVRVEADFDGDGVVGAREAHGSAIASLRTIDVPQATSDAYLRVSVSAQASKWKAPARWTLAQWRTRFSSWDAAVVGALLARLALDARADEALLPRVREGLRSAVSTIEAAEKASDAADARFDSLLRAVRGERERFEPILVLPFAAHHGPTLAPTPEAMRALRARFETHPRHGDLVMLLDAWETAERTALERGHDLALWERLEERLEAVWREAALREPGVVEKARAATVAPALARLRACEDQPWWESTPPKPVAR